jgi:hypothetical protein
MRAKTLAPPTRVCTPPFPHRHRRRTPPSPSAPLPPRRNAPPFPSLPCPPGCKGSTQGLQGWRGSHGDADRPARSSCGISRRSLGPAAAVRQEHATPPSVSAAGRGVRWRHHLFIRVQIDEKVPSWCGRLSCGSTATWSCCGQRCLFPFLLCCLTDRDKRLAAAGDAGAGQDLLRLSCSRSSLFLSLCLSVYCDAHYISFLSCGYEPQHIRISESLV